jgi:transcriptional regulator
MNRHANRIDVQALAILEALTPRGFTYTQEEIAEVAGCTKGNIHMIERLGLVKVRNRLYGKVKELKENR